MSVTYFNAHDLLQDGPEVLPLVTAEGEGHIFPDEKSGPNKLTCPSSSFICRSHLLHDTDLLHEQAGPLARQTQVGGIGYGEILTRAATADDVHRRQQGPVQPGDVPHMEHVGEVVFCHPDGERLNLAGPDRYNAIAHRRQGETANAIEERGHRQIISVFHCAPPLPAAGRCSRKWVPTYTAGC